MANDKVIQLTPDIINQFERKKLIGAAKDMDIELTPVGYGDTVIGTLTPEEARVFLEVQGITDELEAAMFDIKMDASEKAIKEQREKGYKENGGLPFTIVNTTVTDEQAATFGEMDARAKYLDAYFWYSLRQRLKCFSARIGIRQGMKVVRTGWKHKD